MSDLAVRGRAVVLVRKVDPGAATLAVGVLGAIATTIVVVGPEHLLGYQSAAWHLVLETVDACITLLLAYLVYGRFRRASRWQDLLLLQGLVLLGTANILLLLSLIQGGKSGVLDIWLPASLRGLGTLVIAAAALLPDRVAEWSGWRGGRAADDRTGFAGAAPAATGRARGPGRRDAVVDQRSSRTARRPAADAHLLHHRGGGVRSTGSSS
jgi:hypothetical protein